jgi:hypothetical protein
MMVTATKPAALPALGRCDFTAAADFAKGCIAKGNEVIRLANESETPDDAWHETAQDFWFADAMTALCRHLVDGASAYKKVRPLLNRGATVRFEAGGVPGMTAHAAAHFFAEQLCARVRLPNVGSVNPKAGPAGRVMNREELMPKVTELRKFIAANRQPADAVFLNHAIDAEADKAWAACVADARLEQIAGVVAAEPTGAIDDEWVPMKTKELCKLVGVEDARTLRKRIEAGVVNARPADQVGKQYLVASAEIAKHKDRKEAIKLAR